MRGFFMGYYSGADDVHLGMHRPETDRGARPPMNSAARPAAGHRHLPVGGRAGGPVPEADTRWLLTAMVLIIAIMAGEIAAGFLARSLALLSDAAHMLTDAVSVGLALAAARLAARPPRGGYTYGLKRAEILSAQANGLTLLLLGAWLAAEAARRLISPLPVRGPVVLALALAGLAVNLAAAWCISRANRASLNVEGAFQHIVTDVFGFAATAAAGAAIIVTGFSRADAIASLLVVCLMVRAGLSLVRASGRIFLEAAPAGVDINSLGDQMAALPSVVEVHDLHVWQITSGQTAASAHVLVQPEGDCHRVRGALEELLRDGYRIRHTTLQVDHAPEALHQIGRDGPGTPSHCEDPHGPAHRDGPHPH
jgi:cobalt-zinc-cadmium efflux system protein